MTATTDLLRGLPYFEELPHDLLIELASDVEEMDLPAGDTVISEGDIGDAMYIVLDGELEVSKQSEGREIVLNKVGPGEVLGEMALMEDSPRGATVKTTTPVRLLGIPVATFRNLTSDPKFLGSMLTTVIRRLRSTEATLRHEERMAALGRMAAQLMHELNNPAAAVSRSAEGLRDVYLKLGDAGAKLGGLAGSGSQAPTGEPPKSALERSDLEEEIGDWLTLQGVAEPYELAAAFVEGGWSVDGLEDMVSGLDQDSTAALLEWVGLRALAGQLLKEVHLGVGRISELVRVVKGYSFLDQAPIQEIDVRTGIDDTLILMRHKLDGVDVVTEYEEDLPEIEAPGRDLNQVWTNLIDNAADAMDGEGRLQITATSDDNSVTVTVTNTGPTIPPDVLPRVFDPFFTTKEPGKGTGLGLHTTYSVLSKMGGDIDVRSADGETAFTVTLPREATTG